MADTLSSAVLRPGVHGDAAGLVALGRAVVPPTYGPVDADYPAFMLEHWWQHDRLAASLDAIPHVVADVDGQVVGVANLGRRDDREVMWKLYVHPDHQGRGLGGRLLAAVETLVDGDVLWLEHVDGNEPAGAFYRTRGFTEVERVPQPPFPDDIWMRKILR